MWINILDEDIPTKHGETYSLCLKYRPLYGHAISDVGYETVSAKWDNITESFYEVKTGLEIDASEIVEWWKDI